MRLHAQKAKSSRGKYLPPRFEKMESALVNKALLDTSVIFDLERAVSNPKRTWAEATLRNAFEYRNQYRQLTISSSTDFEILAGHVQVGDMAGF
jgi:hypothetical protein